MAAPLQPSLVPNVIFYIDAFSEMTVELKVYDITARVKHLYPTAVPAEQGPVSRLDSPSSTGSTKKRNHDLSDVDSFADLSDTDTLHEAPEKQPWSLFKSNKSKETDRGDNPDQPPTGRDKGKQRKSTLPETNEQRKQRKKSQQQLDFAAFDAAVEAARENLGEPILIIRRRQRWWKFYTGLADVTVGPGMAAFDPTADPAGTELCQYQRPNHSAGKSTFVFGGSRQHDAPVTSFCHTRCSLSACPNERSLSRRMFHDFTPESCTHKGNVYGWRLETGMTQRYHLMKRHLNFRPDVTILPPKAKEKGSRWWRSRQSEKAEPGQAPAPAASPEGATGSAQPRDGSESEDAGKQVPTSRVVLEHDSQCSVPVGRFRWYTKSKRSEFANRSPGATFALDTTGNKVGAVEMGDVSIDPFVATLGCINAVYKSMLRQTERIAIGAAAS